MNPPQRPLSPCEQIDVLLREYDALYALVVFRMASLDRRIPLIAGAITALLTSLYIVPLPARPVLLWQVPAAAVWLLRTTTNHARSFEDALRRIEEIEQAVNDLAGAPLLLFQSRHPSRGRVVGGRTGTETIGSTMMVCLMILAACAYLAAAAANMGPRWMELYALYLAAMLISLIRTRRDVRRYRYVKQLVVED